MSIYSFGINHYVTQVKSLRHSGVGHLFELYNSNVCLVKSHLYFSRSKDSIDETALHDVTSGTRDILVVASLFKLTQSQGSQIFSTSYDSGETEVEN